MFSRRATRRHAGGPTRRAASVRHRDDIETDQVIHSTLCTSPAVHSAVTAIWSLHFVGPWRYDRLLSAPARRDAKRFRADSRRALPETSAGLVTRPQWLKS
jgi:hypothetical protein